MLKRENAMRALTMFALLEATTAAAVDLDGSWYRYKSGSPSTRDFIMIRYDELNSRRGPCQIRDDGSDVVVIDCPNAGGEQERFVRNRSQLRPCNQGFLNLCPD